MEFKLDIQTIKNLLGGNNMLTVVLDDCQGQESDYARQHICEFERALFTKECIQEESADYLGGSTLKMVEPWSWEIFSHCDQSILTRVKKSRENLRQKEKIFRQICMNNDLSSAERLLDECPRLAYIKANYLFNI